MNNIYHLIITCLVLLEDEEDEFWVEYRHNHIAELSDKINAEVKSLKKIEDEHVAISEKIKEFKTNGEIQTFKSEEEKQKAETYR